MTSLARVLHNPHLHVPQLMLFNNGIRRRQYHPNPVGIDVLASLHSMKYNGCMALTKGQHGLSVTARSIYNSEYSCYMVDFVFYNLFFLRKSVIGSRCFLVNPLRGGEVLRLPALNDITKYGRYFNVKRDWYGMGFDSLTNKHKVVRVSRVYNGTYTENCLVTQVLVLGESSWREIPSVPAGDLNMKQVCANADMHWLSTGDYTMKGSEGTWHIISFDFKREAFYRTPHPFIPLLQSSNDKHLRFVDLHLLTLRGSMALVCTSSAGGGTTTDIGIWVLKDYDKKERTRDHIINSKRVGGSSREWEHGIFFDSYMDTVFLDLNSFSVNRIAYEFGEYPLIMGYTRSLVSLKEYGNLVEDLKLNHQRMED